MATLTVGEVINHARDLHPALSETNAPKQLAFRALSRFQRDIYQAIVSRSPAYLALELVITLPLADFDAGVDLSTELAGGWKDLLEGFFFYSDTSPNPRGKVRATFVPWEQRDMGHSLPAFTMRDNVLYFLGGSDYYANFSSFELGYTPIPTDLASNDDVLALPLDAREALAAMLASFWLMRLVGTPAFDVDAATAATWRELGQEARAEFLNRVWGIGKRQDYRVRDVRGGTGFGP